MQVKIHDSLIHYEVINPQGSIPVLFLHGWGHSGFMWRQVAGMLPEDCRSFLVDLPGFGQSSLGSAIRDVHDLSGVIGGLIDRLNLTGVTLVGHSLGAQLSVLVAGNMKGNVSKLILIAPALKRQRDGFDAGWYSFLRLLSRAKRFLPKSIRYHLSSGLDYGAASPGMKNIFKNIIKTDVTHILPTIEIPALVIWGENDREVLGTGKEISALLPYSKLKVLYDTGHNLQMDKPQELSRIMERFILI